MAQGSEDAHIAPTVRKSETATMVLILLFPFGAAEPHPWDVSTHTYSGSYPLNELSLEMSSLFRGMPTE